MPRPPALADSGLAESSARVRSVSALDPSLYPDVPFHPIRRPAVIQRWDDLTFLHWRYPPEAVRQILPSGLEVDAFDGSAWVALVPFRMVGVRPPWVPQLGRLTTFPETNVRTYVMGPDGVPGVWFMSLDITRLLGVALARILFHVPYCWSRMSIDERSESISYSAQRRTPGPKGTASHAVVQPGEPIPQSDLTRFLTNRWRAYARLGEGLAYAAVAHEPWPLRSATVQELTDDLVAAAGMKSPESPPLVHFSDGVAARVGWLTRL